MKIMLKVQMVSRFLFLISACFMLWISYARAVDERFLNPLTLRKKPSTLSSTSSMNMTSSTQEISTSSNTPDASKLQPSLCNRVMRKDPTQEALKILYQLKEEVKKSRQAFSQSVSKAMIDSGGSPVDFLIERLRMIHVKPLTGADRIALKEKLNLLETKKPNRLEMIKSIQRLIDPVTDILSLLTALQAEADKSVGPFNKSASGILPELIEKLHASETLKYEARMEMISQLVRLTTQKSHRMKMIQTVIDQLADQEPDLLLYADLKKLEFHLNLVQGDIQKVGLQQNVQDLIQSIEAFNRGENVRQAKKGFQESLDHFLRNSNQHRLLDSLLKEKGLRTKKWIEQSQAQLERVFLDCEIIDLDNLNVDPPGNSLCEKKLETNLSTNTLSSIAPVLVVPQNKERVNTEEAVRDWKRLLMGGKKVFIGENTIQIPKQSPEISDETLKKTLYVPTQEFLRGMGVAEDRVLELTEKLLFVLKPVSLGFNPDLIFLEKSGSSGIDPIFKEWKANSDSYIQLDYAFSGSAVQPGGQTKPGKKDQGKFTVKALVDLENNTVTIGRRFDFVSD